MKARADGVVGVGAPAAGEAANYATGLLYSGVALMGNTAVSALRKVLAKDPDVGNAAQVGQSVECCSSFICIGSILRTYGSRLKFRQK